MIPMALESMKSTHIQVRHDQSPPPLSHDSAMQQVSQLGGGQPDPVVRARVLSHKTGVSWGRIAGSGDKLEVRTTYPKPGVRPGQDARNSSHGSRKHKAHSCSDQFLC